ncbi:HXXXD-type acyl-transferase family protein [Prunus dulcis]|uniref:HXXXD-type acyl-transferase family protein n=1 Tax=Prunus dulcis TaxID=3755 RepID=A0A4Y1RQD8_PRUDU|nr:HXXXD-type acyl-transferase family protein [Prunus dulcis]
MRYDIEVSHGVGYPALRQTPYVALVVPAYGEICDIMTSYMVLVVPAYEEICDIMMRLHVA